jgi:dynein heavy chain 1
MPESPAWSGLPANAEMRVRAENAKTLLKDFKLMQGNDEDKEFVIAKKGREDKSIKPAHIKKLEETSIILLGKLPQELNRMHRDVELIKNPLFRFLEREVTVASKLLKIVRDDLERLE